MDPFHRNYDKFSGKLIATEDDLDVFNCYQRAIDNNMGDANAMLDIAEALLRAYKECFYIFVGQQAISQETTTRLDNFFDPTVGPYGVDP